MTFNETLDATGGHETMHILAERLWGAPTRTWINEGLAVYSDDNWSSRPLHQSARMLLDRQQLIPIRDLMKRRGFLGNDEVTYPQAGSLVKFVYEVHGRSAVRRFWHGGANAREIAGIEGEWLAMLTRLPRTA